MLDEIGDALENLRVFIHLLFQWRILFANGSKKSCRVAKQFCGQLRVSSHRGSSIFRETAHRFYEARYFVLGGIHRAPCTYQSNVSESQTLDDSHCVKVA